MYLTENEKRLLQYFISVVIERNFNNIYSIKSHTRDDILAYIRALPAKHDMYNLIKSILIKIMDKDSELIIRFVVQIGRNDGAVMLNFVDTTLKFMHYVIGDKTFPITSELLICQIIFLKRENKDENNINIDSNSNNLNFQL